MIHKKVWLTPVILVVVMYGALILLGKASVITPSLYTLF